jgi:hypothetical protein
LIEATHEKEEEHEPTSKYSRGCSSSLGCCDNLLVELFW